MAEHNQSQFYIIIHLFLHIALFDQTQAEVEPSEIEFMEIEAFQHQSHCQFVYYHFVVLQFLLAMQSDPMRNESVHKKVLRFLEFLTESPQDIVSRSKDKS